MSKFFALLQANAWVKPGVHDALKAKSDEALYDIVCTQLNVPEADLHAALSNAYGWPRISLSQIVMDQALVNKCLALDPPIKRSLPLYRHGSALVVASANPFLQELAHLERRFGICDIQLCADAELQQFLAGDAVDNLSSMVKQVLMAASQKSASDVHIHQSLDGLSIQFRVQGALIPYQQLPVHQAMGFLQSLKLMAHCDVSQRQLPQDGRIQFHLDGHAIDGRVSTLPTLYGEDVVIRLFQTQLSLKPLDELGFKPAPLQLFRQGFCQSSGLVLVTGPTGSGKSSTLYAVLKSLAEDSSKTIITLEDPIECSLPKIRQSQVNAKAGYTFKTGLRAILRQDPDVIMIGEIRDKETAEIALQAAYTGHLVLSTLHTSDVASSLMRLLGFGLDPFLCRYCLKSIVSQRLVRVLCETCSGAGCEACDFKGVLGRRLQVEVLGFVSAQSTSSNPQDWLKEATHYAFDEDQITGLS